MKKKTLYQTLENRDNLKKIVEDAPYPCHWENTWLGVGYYFWDTFIENAHWWGNIRYKDQYIICKFTCDFDTSKCFDLVGDTDHMLDFSQTFDLLKELGLIEKETTVSRVFAFLRNTDSFKYEAIRVYGIKSMSDFNTRYSKYRHRLQFETGGTQYLDFKPAIQICIFTKDGLSLSSAQVVYPYEYNPDYLT